MQRKVVLYELGGKIHGSSVMYYHDEGNVLLLLMYCIVMYFYALVGCNATNISLCCSIRIYDVAINVCFDEF